MKLTKKRKKALEKLDALKYYNVEDACDIVKKAANSNFDESVDLAVRLGVDPKKANQMVRGVVTLPNGTGKDVKVLALVTADKVEEAKKQVLIILVWKNILKKLSLVGQKLTLLLQCQVLWGNLVRLVEF